MKNWSSHKMHSESIMQSKQFLDLVNEFKDILVYRHVNPDGDALGSQGGMALWLKLNFPNKNIFMMGEDDHNFKIYEKMSLLESLPKPFLSIVCDSATQARIADQSYIEGDKIIKIDHHPEVDKYGDLQIVNVASGSACEIVSELLISLDMKMNKQIADTLLSGILTDTQKFSIEATSAQTLRTAADLMDFGANITKLNEALFSSPKEIWERRRMLQNEVQFNGALAYAIIDKEKLESFNLLEREAKVFVNMMAGIEEYNIWGIFTQDEDGTYNGSLRSRTHTINDIAAEFNGGGHRLACGVNKLSKIQMFEVIERLKETSLK